MARLSDDLESLLADADRKLLSEHADVFRQQGAPDELARRTARLSFLMPACDIVRIARAAELGLSEALIRQVRGVAADLAGERPGRKSTPPTLGARTCLSCDRVFLSTGPGNRLCMRCRGGDAGLAQL